MSRSATKQQRHFNKQILNPERSQLTVHPAIRIHVANRVLDAFSPGLVVVAVVLFWFGSSANADGCLDDERAQSPSSIPSLAAGDEAFTEPIETIKVAASETGIIGKVKIKRGDNVNEGDLLFELDMSVLEASRRLSQAKANTKARLKSAEVEYESKQKHYKKLVELFAEEAGSPQEVEQAKTDAEVARQNIEAILEENEQFTLETKRIESQMERRRIRSPIHGVVIDIRKKPGEYVSNSDPHIATIVKLETLRVVFHLPTIRATKIKRGDTADILLTETNQHAVGIVEYVAPVTDAASGRVRVEVLIRNGRAEYRSGVRCRVVETYSRRSMMDEATDQR